MKIPRSQFTSVLFFVSISYLVWTYR